MKQENVFLDDIGWEVEVNPDKVFTIQTPAKKKRKTRLLKKNEESYTGWICWVTWHPKTPK